MICRLGILRVDSDVEYPQPETPIPDPQRITRDLDKINPHLTDRSTQIVQAPAPGPPLRGQS